MDRMEQARDGRVELAKGALPRSGERERFDAYEAITSRIIERIESGVVPWQSPSIARVGFPRNFSTGKLYSGINVFLLGSHEFQSPHFLTFIQARELGGHVRKGEKGSSSGRSVKPNSYQSSGIVRREQRAGCSQRLVRAPTRTRRNGFLNLIFRKA